MRYLDSQYFCRALQSVLQQKNSCGGPLAVQPVCHASASSCMPAAATRPGQSALWRGTSELRSTQ